MCGEEKHLFIQSRVSGYAATRPQSAVSGLFDKPTLINNVETWAEYPGCNKQGGDFLQSVEQRK